MSLVATLLVIIAILTIALIIETISLIKLHKDKSSSDWQLSWYNRLLK